ncbi:MAG: RodZ domain-containing protein [Pseudomonadota bacterium]|nr:RodZ domain-containing protein [Pseudomonadota bacterium]
MATENTEITAISSIGLPGSLLRQAREEKGLTVDEMSAISNLTKQVIRRIESDDYADLAGLSFVRGYLKLYAKKLGVNEAAVLEPFDLWKAEQSGDAKHKATKPGMDDEQPAAGPGKATIIFATAVIVVLIVSGATLSYMESEQSESEVIATLPSVESSDRFREDTLQKTEQSVVDQAPNELVASVGDESPGTSPDTSDGDTSIDITVNTGSDDSANEEHMANVAAAEDAAVSGPALADSQTEALATVPLEVPVEPEIPAEPERSVEPEKPVESPQVVKTVEPVVNRAVAEPEIERSADQIVEESEPNPVVSTGNLGQGGRVIAEASGLAPAPAEPVQTTQVSPGQDEGLRVVSETVTGPSADQLAMGVAGKLQIEFSGESWVEVRDARGRLILADLMTPENGVDLDTYGPIEVLVGAVSASTVIFNGETQDLRQKAFQDVARITLGADLN